MPLICWLASSNCWLLDRLLFAFSLAFWINRLNLIRLENLDPFLLPFNENLPHEFLQRVEYCAQIESVIKECWPPSRIPSRHILSSTRGNRFIYGRKIRWTLFLFILAREVRALGWKRARIYLRYFTEQSVLWLPLRVTV